MFGRDTNAFIFRLGHLTTSISGERRESEFLRQRLSLEKVRGNAQSVTQAELAAQAHELGLPCVICELHFAMFTLCTYPFHVCMNISWKIKFG